MKLKRKIFLIFSLVAVIPMIFLTTYTVVQYTHMIDNRMEDISHEQQENLSDAIDASYTSIRQVFMLLTFASNTDSSIIKILRPYADPEIHMTNMEIYRACLQLRNANQNIFYTYDFLNGVYVYTPSGNLISYETSKNGTIAQTYNPKNDDWYNRTIESGGKMYYSSLDEHPMFESKNKSIFFSQTIIDPDTGKFLGVLIIDCSPELFNLDSVKALGNMNQITLTNTINQSVYYTNDSDGSFSIKPDASNTLYTEIDHTPLLLALTLDYSSLREDYTRIAFLLVIVSALCILCVLLFTFYFSNSMLLPIEELSEQMLHQSDPVVHSKKDYTCRKDEIGTLYRQYDMMLEIFILLGGFLISLINSGLTINVINFLFKFFSNYGIIILILTVIIKLIILPLTYKSYMSSAKMRVLQPQLNEINERYPNQEDALKKQQAVMELYKKCGVSPMGGCIPMLIQMPILIAMFRFLPASIELRGQHFLWAEDLSSYDSVLQLPFKIPFYGDHVSMFALLMALAMFFYSRMTYKQTASAGPQMAGMKFMTVYLMPILMLCWFNSYASGLTYYYLLSQLFTMLIMYIIRYSVNEEKLLAKLQSNAAKADRSAATKKKSKWQMRYEEALRQQQQMQRQQQQKAYGGSQKTHTAKPQSTKNQPPKKRR